MIFFQLPLIFAIGKNMLQALDNVWQQFEMYTTPLQIILLLHTKLVYLADLLSPRHCI